MRKENISLIEELAVRVSLSGRGLESKVVGNEGVGKTCCMGGSAGSEAMSGLPDGWLRGVQRIVCDVRVDAGKRPERSMRR